MAFDTNDLNYPTAIDQSLQQYLKGFLHSGPNFGPTDRMFSSLMMHPSFMEGPGGGFVDPSQMNQTYGTNMLNERGDIASQNIQDKGQAAGLLTGLGSSIANFQNAKTSLGANALGGAGSFYQLFGGGGY